MHCRWVSTLAFSTDSGYVWSFRIWVTTRYCLWELFLHICCWCSDWTSSWTPSAQAYCLHLPCSPASAACTDICWACHFPFPLDNGPAQMEASDSASDTDVKNVENIPEVYLSSGYAEKFSLEILVRSSTSMVEPIYFSSISVISESEKYPLKLSLSISNVLLSSCIGINMESEPT